ncbi:hypothetical protein [Salinarimonas sp.]|uniref:hypothetical protein n=1 Tax=Salinarimonas sp. TaxID=2766526 RepID=UPI0032D9AA6E
MIRLVHDDAKAPAGASDISPIAREDVPAVAALFRKTFGRADGSGDGALEAYIERLFVEPLEAEPEIASLVHRTEAGSVDGFVGVIAMPFVVDGAMRRAAFCGALMVADATRDPLAGAKLLRTFLNGPQDLSLSETANAISEGMWRRLRGTVLPAYSLEWIRVFRPVAFAHAVAAAKRPALRRLRGLAVPLDALARRAMPALAASACTEEEIVDDAAFAALLERFTAQAAARPAWSEMDLDRMIEDARSKARYGAMTRRLVRRGAMPIGLYVRHAEPGGIGHVLQIAAAPGRMQDVIDRLFASAAEEGLAGLRGRSQPAILEAVLTRGCAYAHRASTLVHARDQALIEPFLAGRAFVNGFAGESWTRLIGDDLAG